MKRASTFILLNLLIATLAFAQVPPFPGGGRPGPGGPGAPNNPPPTNPQPPTPTPTSNPSAARQTGFGEGHPLGKQEAQVRAQPEGQQAGRVAGYNQGFKDCEAQERKRMYDQGYQRGYQEGYDVGNVEGNNQGTYDGNDVGQRDGNADGLRRADYDAKVAATPPGTAQGEKEAENSDAAKKGYADGLLAGDQAARDQAVAVDYPKGRQEYKDERFAEPISAQDAFAQKQAEVRALGLSGLAKAAGLNSLAKNLNIDGMEMIGERASQLNVVASPDYRFSRPTRTFPDPVEQSAYLEGYRSGYTEGFNALYSSLYQQAYQQAYNYNYQSGCTNGRNQDFSYDYSRGRQEGHRAGYRVGYDRSYRPAYDNAYRNSFNNASQIAYQNSYQGYYNRHFESARVAAYQRRYGEIYNSNFETAKNIKYQQVYPGYAAQENKRGRADEAQDFVNRPVRIIGALATETLKNGLFEPGETLRVKLQIRNFNTAGIAAQDLQIQIRETTSNGAVISIPSEGLVQGLRGKSLTTVEEGLGFVLSEAAVNKGSTFTVTVLYKGTVSSETKINVTAQFALDVNFAEKPVLKEGLEATMKVVVQNKSQANIDSGTLINLVSDASKLEVTQGSAVLGSLSPGQQHLIEFKAIVRVPGQSISIPLTVSVKEKAGRRIGLMDGIKQITVKNDFTVSLHDDMPNLREADKHKVEFEIHNLSAQSSNGACTVVLRFLGPNASNFSTKSGNTLEIKKIKPSDYEKAEFKVISKNQNSGGTLEIEVIAGGTTTVIHRIAF